MKENFQISENSAKFKKTVEVGNSIFPVSDKRFEFVSLESKKGAMSLCVEQFVHLLNYCKSEEEYQTFCILFEEYLDLCQKNNIVPITPRGFLSELDYLGFKVERGMTANTTFIYYQKKSQF